MKYDLMFYIAVSCTALAGYFFGVATTIKQKIKLETELKKLYDLYHDLIVKYERLTDRDEKGRFK